MQKQAPLVCAVRGREVGETDMFIKADCVRLLLTSLDAGVLAAQVLFPIINDFYISDECNHIVCRFSTRLLLAQWSVNMFTFGMYYWIRWLFQKEMR